MLAYLLGALGIAFLDRNAHVFAKFYLFRPSSFTLLLIIAAVVPYLRGELSARSRATSALFLLAIVAPAYWSAVQAKVEEGVRGYPTRAHVALKAAIATAKRPLRGGAGGSTRSSSSSSIEG